MFNENLKITGSVKFVLTDKDGNVKEEHEFKNLVVDAGKAFIASRMAGASSNVMSHFAIGDDATAPAAGNTALGDELGRVALSSTTPSTNTVVYTASVPAGTGTGAITEAGIFNASSGGTMLCRTTFAVINKAASDGLSATWTITIS